MENIPNQFLGLSNSIEKFRAFASILEEKIEDKVGWGGAEKTHPVHSRIWYHWPPLIEIRQTKKRKENIMSGEDLVQANFKVQSRQFSAKTNYPQIIS